MSVAERAAPQRTTAAVKGRVLAGTLLFIAGFTVVFVATAILFSGVGKLFFRYERTLEIVIGALVVVLGLGYLGVIPGMQREFRIRWLPSAGLLGAPVLGAVFALGWTPCLGPTLAAVIATASGTQGATAVKGVALIIAYCAGLGIPFVILAFSSAWALRSLGWLRTHARLIQIFGGIMLIAVGVALVTGWWDQFIVWVRDAFISDTELPV